MLGVHHTPRGARDGRGGRSRPPSPAPRATAFSTWRQATSSPRRAASPSSPAPAGCSARGRCAPHRALRVRTYVRTQAREARLVRRDGRRAPQRGPARGPSGGKSPPRHARAVAHPRTSSRARGGQAALGLHPARLGRRARRAPAPGARQRTAGRHIPHTHTHTPKHPAASLSPSVSCRAAVRARAGCSVRRCYGWHSQSVDEANECCSKVTTSDLDKVQQVVHAACQSAPS